jgi:hypothetical protein
MTTSPIFSSGVRTHRYRVALNAGGVRAGRHLASRLTYITTFRFEQRHVLVTVISRNQLPDRPALAPVTDLEPYLQQTAAARQAEFNRLRKGPPDHPEPAR